MLKSKCKNICCLAISVSQRNITTSTTLNGKRNFRKFIIPNKRGSRIYRESQRTEARELPIDKRGVRDTGYYVKGRYVEIPEKIPDLIVPDLSGCKLLPYVSYKTPDIVQTEFTSQDLFNSVYAKKIVDDFNKGRLTEDGQSLEPSEEENITPEIAIQNARKTGSDIF